MNDPHLLPNQIDLLVDGDAGSTARTMRAHLADCPDCRHRFERAQDAAHAVEALPHFTPRLPFADHVMAKVQVIEPWHVALTGSALRLVPTRGPVRVLTTIGISLAALAISAGALWLALRGDLATWMLSLAFERGRETLVAGARNLGSGVLGTDATTLASGGAWPLALTAGLLTVALIGAALGFRHLAATARANRS